MRDYAEQNLIIFSKEDEETYRSRAVNNVVLLCTGRKDWRWVRLKKYL